MLKVRKQIREMRDLWNSLSRKSKFGFVSHLQSGQQWDPAEFHVTGMRFVDRMVERIQDYGNIEPTYATVLETGCGVGRFLKPLACRFRAVTGVDISEEMLKTAKQECISLPNITYLLGDGQTLRGVGDNTQDYCVSAGVFQHITDFGVILSYISEALRVLKPGGLFLFQFEGNRTDAIGAGQRGAKITARALDEGLKDYQFKIREVSIDPTDRVRNVVVVIQKPAIGESVGNQSFARHKMMERPWMAGVYDDIKTKTLMHERQAQAPLPLTFYED
jgi:ubiquinone/menaquinone biosynthesis C-methylase UbiE